MTDGHGIGQRLKKIRQRIDTACLRSSRDPACVELVGVSKGQPLERLQAAWEAGLRVFGENRVQEAARKAEAMPAEVRWHLIGPLQSNKVKTAVSIFETIHAVDRMKIARRLDREVQSWSRPPLRCFLEINLGEETSKQGFSPATFVQEAQALTALEHLDFVGLMAIPPRSASREEARAWFVCLRTLRDELWEQPWWRSSEDGLLSMGMSGDFEEAIAEGATHVRVGTALFGPRPTPPSQVSQP